MSKQYSGEPAIINGDFIKQRGDYQRNKGIDNAVYILVGTNSGYWGNLIAPDNSKIPGGLEKLEGAAITSSFLKRHSSSVEAALFPLVAQNIAKSIKVESFNPEADRIEWIAKIVLVDGNKYYFDSTSGGYYE